MLFKPGLVEFLLLFIWITALVLCGLGTLLGAWRLRRRRAARVSVPLPAVSVLKPLKGIDDGLEENLEGFFRQRYPEYELLFSVSDESDPALAVARHLMAKYPAVPARVFIGDVPAGLNPKVNNLVKPFAFATHEWVLISDSNTRVDPDFLARLAGGLDSRTALRYCVVAGTGPLTFGGRLDSISLNTMYARGTILAAAGGYHCVTGKAMLLRKGVIEELGGIRNFAPEVAEDFVIGRAFQKLGHRVQICPDPVRQFVGRGTVTAYWSRTVRWGRIRKIHAPRALFLLEPLLLSSVGSGLAGAIAMKLAFHASMAAVFAAHMALWYLFDHFLLRALGIAPGLKDGVAWLVREALHPLQWLHIAIGDTVEWRGRVLKMEKTNVLERVLFDHAVGPAEANAGAP